MAEKTDKKSDDKAAQGGAGAHGDDKKKAGAGGFGALLRSTPALLGVVMAVEAAALIAGFKLLGGGANHASGAQLATGETGGDGHGDPAAAPGGAAKVDPKKLAEVLVLEFRAPNKLRGRTYLYDVAIYVATKAEHKDRVEQAIKAREATLKDRVRTIIAQSDPEKLEGGSEPGLETLRRQVKFQIDELVGDSLVHEVLIPRCIPYRAEF